MAERYQRTIEIAKSKIPQEILNKLAPFGDSIEELLTLPLHFAHGPLHIAEVRVIGRKIAQHVNFRQFVKKPKFSFNELERFDQAAYAHDTGYHFVENCKILKPEEHHYGSWFVAKKLGFSNEVCWGVLEHIRDRLTDKHPWWLWNLVSADRLAGMGYSGILREVALLGVKHSIFDNSLGNVDNVVDLRDIDKVKFKTRYKKIYCFPTRIVEELSETDYENKPRQFFESEILPILTSNQKRILANKIGILLERYDGDTNAKVTGIIDEARMFEFKWFNTIKIEETLTRRN